MVRLTITLSDERLEQLSLKASREHLSVDQVIERSLAELDRARRERALEIVARGRTNAATTMGKFSDDEIERWVLDELALRHDAPGVDQGR